jgi:hypothetical protein
VSESGQQGPVGIRGAGPARKGRRGHEWWRLGLETHGEVHVIYAAYMHRKKRQSSQSGLRVGNVLNKYIKFPINFPIMESKKNF